MDQTLLVAGEVEAGPDDDTAPLPVILPQRGSDSDPGGTRVRGPFEPAGRSRTPAADAGPADGAMAPVVPGAPAGTPSSAEPPVAQASSSTAPPTSADAKLEQIKDLYLTAEAIGDDALGKHFEQVSERQRQLIKEYFDQAFRDAIEGGTS